MVDESGVEIVVDNFIIYFSSEDKERSFLASGLQDYLIHLKKKGFPKGSWNDALVKKIILGAIPFMASDTTALDMKKSLPDYMKYGKPFGYDGEEDD